MACSSSEVSGEVVLAQPAASEDAAEPTAEEHKQSCRDTHRAAAKQNSKASAKRRRDRPAAGVILLLGHGRCPEKVVITCQLRRGQESWELPKGGLEDDELQHVEAAAAREFWEETGVTNELVRLIPLRGYGSRRIHWFLTRIGAESELQWGQTADEDTLEARCLTLEEAMRVLRGDHRELLVRVVQGIRDGKLRWA